MDPVPKQRSPTRALWSVSAVLLGAAASSLVMALGRPVPADVGRKAIERYVTSVEQSDSESACHHARNASALYLEHGETDVGEAWRAVAARVCAVAADAFVPDARVPEGPSLAERLRAIRAANRPDDRLSKFMTEPTAYRRAGAGVHA